MDLKELLGEDLFNQVSEKLGDKKIMIDDKNFIPKARFDEVNEAKKELEKQISDRDKQLKDLSVKAQGNEELTKQIEELQLSNKQIAKDYEEKINKMQFDNALEGALTNAKCKNTKALKALLDIDNVKLNEGKLEGLEEQLNKLKESDSYLFDLEPQVPNSTGGLGNFGRMGKPGITKEEFDKMSYSQRMELYQSDRESYNALTSEN